MLSVSSRIVALKFSFPRIKLSGTPSVWADIYPSTFLSVSAAPKDGMGLGTDKLRI